MAFEPIVEKKVLQLGEAILNESRGPHGSKALYHHMFLQRVLDDPELKTQILRLVDVLPTLENDRQLAEHLALYLGNQALPLPWPGLAQWGLRHSRRGIPAHLIATAARMLCRKMARGFIVGETPDDIEPRLRRMWERGQSCSLDILGEASTGESSALAYQRAYLNLISELSRKMQAWPIPSGPGLNMESPQLHLSVKVSSLYSQIRTVDPDGSVKAMKERLRPILSAARAAGAFILLDMEQFDYRTITLRVFQEILMEEDFRKVTDAGIAVQAYLRDTPEFIAALIAWAKRRGAPVTVRLVRGAYWDYERTLAMQNFWPSPVWEHKFQTDLCYEQCLELLLRSYPVVRTAIASHNPRSVCAGAVLAQTFGLSPKDYEFQMLFGMADDLAGALIRRQLALRIYAPFGPLLPGIAYLVRRLMENSSNESFLRRGTTSGHNAAMLMAPPAPPPARELTAQAGAKAGAFTNMPPMRFADSEQHAAFASAVRNVRQILPVTVHPRIAGKQIDRRISDECVNPSHPDMIVSKTAQARREDVQPAVEAARKAFDAWRDIPVQQRADMLDRTATLLAERRTELAAWEIFEAGKPWMEADADICEAIDHIRYSAYQARRLLVPRDLGVLGESDTYSYHGRGVAAIIAPWNFPLAIVAAMTAAALAAGNTVIIKPARQTPVMAHWLVGALEQAGFPCGTVNLLPGGDDIGQALVDHRDIDFIAFTGSEAVGRRIISAAAAIEPGQRRIKHVIAEMGGKNAIIVDDDADIDEAVPEIAASAFGYAGQKCSACSRLIVLSGIYDRLIRKLLDAVGSLRIGPAEEPSTYIGPLIDSAARDRVRLAIEKAAAEARMIFQAPLPEHLDGYYVPPVIFADVPPDGFLAQEEIFGPVLAVFRVENIQAAIDLANHSRYGLTGGLMSRNPEHIDLVRRRMEAGNIYINRRITGAVVNRQPFGGMKLSGLGSKAGGPDYLLQFVQARVITENTVRHGFVPPGL